MLRHGHRWPSSGRDLARLLTAVAAATLWGCSPTEPDPGTDDQPEVGLSIRIDDPLLRADLGDVDSLRLVLSTPDSLEYYTYCFDYASRRAPVDSIPSVVPFQLYLAWLDSTGTPLVELSRTVTSLVNGHIDLAVEGGDVAPRAPDGPAVRPLSATTALLTWTDRSHFEDHYAIDRAADSAGAFTALGTTVSTHYLDTTIHPGTLYHFRVRAVNRAGTSRPCAAVTLRRGGADTLAPTLAILSQGNRDTVSLRLLTLFGVASDSSSVAYVRVNDALATIAGGIWRIEGLMLDSGDNAIRIRAVDASPDSNATDTTVHVVYDPDYVATLNNAPFFTVRSANLVAALKAETEYRKVVRARDTDPYNQIRIVAHPTLTLTADTLISWTPTLADTGAHTFWARVFDQDGAEDSLSWVVTVLDPRLNTPPRFLSTRGRMRDSVRVDYWYADTVSAVDAEQDTGLVYHLSIGDDTRGIDPRTGAVEWLAEPGDLGPRLLTATVTDDSGAAAHLSWIVTVFDPTLPSCNAGDDTTVGVNDTVRLHGEGNKTGGTIVAWAWDMGNSGVFVPTSGPDTSFAAPATAINPYVCVLRVRDNAGNTADDRVSIRVVLGAPAVDAGPDRVVRAGSVYMLRGDAIDTYGAIVSTQWMSAGASSWSLAPEGVFSATAPTIPGKYTCRFMAIDDDGNSAIDALTLMVVGSTLRHITPVGDSAAAAALFTMGSDHGAPEEQPAHAVAITPFLIDTAEITQAAYQLIMRANPSSFSSPDYPVEGITWFDAVLFCNARSVLEGFDTVYAYAGVAGEPGNGCTGLTGLVVRHGVVGYRLPTEAEWEYALGAGARSEWAWGSDTLNAGAFAWYEANANAHTHGVATRRANALGLYDMAGNVWEWCNDWYDPDYYAACKAAGTAIDPTGPVSGVARTIRGGSWQDNINRLRTVTRQGGIPSWSSSFVGFRCVLPL